MAAQRIFPQELHYSFARVLERRLRNKGIAGLRSFVADLVPELVYEVPTAAFEPSAPSDRGVFFYHGLVDEQRALNMKKWDRRDWYLTAQEALEEKLVDGIAVPPVYRRTTRKTPNR